MASDKHEPVEKFKLTKDLLEIERAYRQREKVLKALQTGINIKTKELSELSNVLFKVENQQKALIKMVPPEQQSVEGTPLPSPNLQINY